MWQAIPISRQPHILELAIGRLQDKSSIVRKSALQLLKTCLIYNPFGAQVSEYPLVQKVKNITDETVFLFFFGACVLYIPKAATGSQVPFFSILSCYIFIYLFIISLRYYVGREWFF